MNTGFQGSSLPDLSEKIKEKTRELGFDICGIARSRPLMEYRPILEEWIGAGMHDRMNFLARDIPKRLDPGFLLKDAKSLVVTGLNYYSDIIQEADDVPLFSRYTYGIDYHEVILSKLNRLLEWIKVLDHDVAGRPVVDSASILEKAWAREAGLGWQGRHSIVISREAGSFFFIGILILNIELDYDEPFEHDLCGDCRLCIDECPTAAINNNRTIDARKCISALTIESRQPLPGNILPLFGRRIYGCDRCQEVCPWNSRVKINNNREFDPDPEIARMTREDWLTLPLEKFSQLFGRSVLRRIRYEKFMENVRAVLNVNN
ncbi:MAG TPA: tRNA epoxyqueuosine(34) reductase QueG [Bacteroidales bacterium]|jgi:epoxyqueuosine reductase|nr:tRNA epoxyqueuosine(34) reductase QueG [Bacteroidales bacterium]HNR41186.1 tRNA epoxyqueuosine(34) reductase QueG [Bacteroidales bacterium]HPM18253.1 tRNA epoxyqueuosine(34) reductase QueG [Bacteroidales bacterium]